MRRVVQVHQCPFEGTASHVALWKNIHVVCASVVPSRKMQKYVEGVLNRFQGVCWYQRASYPSDMAWE
jgi:hypothetical protein